MKMAKVEKLRLCTAHSYFTPVEWCDCDRTKVDYVVRYGVRYLGTGFLECRANGDKRLWKSSSHAYAYARDVNAAFSE